MIRIIRKFFGYLKHKDRIKAVLIMILMLVGGIMESLSVSLILPMLTAVVDVEGWTDSWYARIICDIFNIDNQRNYIQLLIILLIVIFILKDVFLMAEYYIQYSFISNCRFRMQKQLMNRYMSKPYSFFLYANSGEIIRIATTDTAQSFQLMKNIMIFCTEGVVCVILAITLYMISPVIAIALCVVLGVEVLLLGLVIKPIMRRIGVKTRDSSAVANKWLLQSINGIKSIKVTNTEDYFESEYNKYAGTLVDLERKNQTLMDAPRLIIEAVTVSGVLCIVFIMVLLGEDIVSIIPILSAFVVAAVRLLPSVNRLSAVINQAPFLEGSFDNVLNILDGYSEDANVKADVGSSNNNFETLSFDDKIEFKNISFKYPNTNNYIFRNASFNINSGQSVGIIGASGSGKTTAVDIILGLLEPQEGAVLVDGVNIKEYGKAWLFHTAYIPQQIFLIDDSIKNNVIFGNEDMGEEAIWACLEEASLADFVRQLPNGIETDVGEQGVRLSGGQRQRIGIARALYNNPDILFFDEATSALDNDTETAIMEAIDHLRGNKTIIIIAHRLTTIKKCDVVVKVENGKVDKV